MSIGRKEVSWDTWYGGTMAARKAASKPTKKKAVGGSFAAVVRKVVGEALPAYRFVDTQGGSGPLVRFQRPADAIVEHVVFQKGLHGADWFRVNLVASFVGPGALGPREHVLSEGGKLGPDVRWESDAELEAALRSACALLEPKAKELFGAFEEAAPRYAKLFGDLPLHYAVWMKAQGASLPPEQFRGEEKVEAFDAFFAWLGRKKLVDDDLPGDLLTCLWRFWHEARPMRESDYDPEDYYDCAQCSAFVRRARATLTQHALEGFGTHYALVCAKHRSRG